MTTPRYAFGTAAWFDLMRSMLDERLAAFRARASPERLARTGFSMAEIALEPPVAVGRGAARAGWRCRVEAGRLVEFDTENLDGAAHTVSAPFELLQRLARFDTTEREQEYEALTRAALATGELRVEGPPPRAPREFIDIHNTIARSTL